MDSVATMMVQHLMIVLERHLLNTDYMDDLMVQLFPVFSILHDDFETTPAIKQQKKIIIITIK